MENVLSNVELMKLAADLSEKLAEVLDYGESIQKVVDHSAELINQTARVFNVSVDTFGGTEHFEISYNEANFNLLRKMLDNDMVVLSEEIYKLRKQIGINE